ncbi:uncharacterized protein LOC108459104 [Gossypium arboreum]|uniref:uncharacterized protein LOC108459104 n=1 Tax=Gossypium arboreum TaxID=29729 RepID=UPI00081914BA|nr:uncharacterized protein LOC108459104 [Gossypium arboreum]
MKQYGHVTDIAPDRITLQNMEKRSGESFRKYAQKWREVTTQVQLPLLKKEMTMLFINTLKVPFINHMLENATKSFANIVMSGEMIENAIRCGKIEMGESTERSAPKKKENEVNNVSSGYSKPVTVNQSRTSPYPKWYNANTQCEYHARVVGHSIESCISFKKLVEKLINMGVVKFDDTPVVGNPLPSHTDGGVNTIIENVGRRVKLNADEVKTSFREVWKKMLEMGLITQSSKSNSREVGDYCEFHGEKGHEIQSYKKFRALVQGLMDNKELEFFELTGEEDVCAAEEKSIAKVCEASHPVVIISQAKISEAEARVAPRIVIQKPKAFHFRDSKRVPWNYSGSVIVLEKKSSDGTLSTEAEPVKKKSFVIRQGEKMSEPLVNEPVMENEVQEFLKFLKHSEYSAVEQLHKQPARISILTLLLSSETHRDTLMKVLNETYVADDISINKLDRLISNISADNFISFSDDEIPLGGMRSTKALHITTRCNGYMLPGMLIDNGSVLNVLPLSTLNRLPMDSSHMKTCKNIVRAFDGTERKVMGRIEIPLLIEPNTYEVDFLVMDIKPSYNCLLGRPWIYSAGAVPSLLHQKLKLVTEGQLITINAEEDIITSVASDAPYIDSDNEGVECSLRSLEFVNATFITEGGRIPVPRLSEATKMSLQLTVGRGALLGRGFGKYLNG